MQPTLTPLWRRFPAADQFLRARLVDELLPTVMALTADPEAIADGRWLVTLRWPEAGFSAAERFSADELRAVRGRWAHWAEDAAAYLAQALGK